MAHTKSMWQTVQMMKRVLSWIASTQIAITNVWAAGVVPVSQIEIESLHFSWCIQRENCPVMNSKAPWLAQHCWSLTVTPHTLRIPVLLRHSVDSPANHPSVNNWIRTCPQSNVLIQQQLTASEYKQSGVEAGKLHSGLGEKPLLCFHHSHRPSECQSCTHPLGSSICQRAVKMFKLPCTNSDLQMENLWYGIYCSLLQLYIFNHGMTWNSRYNSANR